ncbi:MAG TPA: hypothetical protein VFB54_03660 [Burkholderiales bacterium]|nr:hypothetical protein [Burkholderiales bacterium]
MNTNTQPSPFPSRLAAGEAALMRWNPATSLGEIRALRAAQPGWPLVRVSETAKAVRS